MPIDTQLTVALSIGLLLCVLVMGIIAVVIWLAWRVGRLEERYNVLQGRYTTLKQDHSVLLERYGQLNEYVKRLTAYATKLEGVVRELRIPADSLTQDRPAPPERT